MDRIHLVILILAGLFLLARSENGTVYTLREGDDLKVNCTVPDYLSEFYIYWIKNDTESTFHQDGKELEISNISSAASGDYICHGLNTSHPEPDYNKTSVNVTIEVIHVDVQYAARILHFNITPTLLMENDTFNISCNLQANPPPTWSIRNRDTGLVFMSAYGQGADALLTSPPALCEYTGYWECTGYNNLSEHGNVTQGNDVTILCSPRPVYQGNNFTVKSEVGQAAYLVMHLISHPVPTYRWSRDDGSNFTDDVIQHDYDNKTILEFPSVSIYDFGVYTLTMTNIYGSYTSKYQLTATGKPEPPTDVKYRDVTEHDVTLSWTPGYDMGSKQYFLVMMFMNETKLYLQISSEIYCPYKNLQPNQTCTHTQENLNGNSHYNLKIAAKNDYRYVSFSNGSVEFTTKAHPTKPDSNYLREVIIGITIGGICFVCIVAAIVFFQKKRRLSSYISIAS